MVMGCHKELALRIFLEPLLVLALSTDPKRVQVRSKRMISRQKTGRSSRGQQRDGAEHERLNRHDVMKKAGPRRQDTPEARHC